MLVDGVFTTKPILSCRITGCPALGGSSLENLPGHESYEGHEGHEGYEGYEGNEGELAGGQLFDMFCNSVLFVSFCFLPGCPSSREVGRPCIAVA